MMCEGLDVARSEVEVVTGQRVSIGKLYELFAELREALSPKPERDAYSIAEFCERHGISIPMYYKLREQGLTPLEFRVGVRVLISKEAAAAWRREREAASAAATAA
jgi:hypothetical protein